MQTLELRLPLSDIEGMVIIQCTMTRKRLYIYYLRTYIQRISYMLKCMGCVGVLFQFCDCTTGYTHNFTACSSGIYFIMVIVKVFWWLLLIYDCCVCVSFRIPYEDQKTRRGIFKSVTIHLSMYRFCCIQV